MFEIKIRQAQAGDEDPIRKIYREAFAADEAPAVAELAVALLHEDSSPKIINLVAEVDGGLIGHVGFSPIYRAGGAELLGYILAPLAVIPREQKRGVGSQLVESGLEACRRLGAQFFLVYGDPNYYARFGFDAELARGCAPAFPLSYPHGLQALDWRPGADQRVPVSFRCVEPLNRPEFW